MIDDLLIGENDQMIADLLIGANVLTNVVRAAVVVMIAQALRAMFQRVAESVIHAGLGQRRWSEIHLACVHEYSNQISQNMLQAKNLRKAFAQNC
jgi:hypothetical protein